MLISLSTLPDEQPASRWGKSPASVNSNAAVKVVSSRDHERTRLICKSVFVHPRQVSPNDFGMLRNGLVMKNALVLSDLANFRAIGDPEAIHFDVVDVARAICSASQLRWAFSGVWRRLREKSAPVARSALSHAPHHHLH